MTEPNEAKDLQLKPLKDEENVVSEMDPGMDFILEIPLHVSVELGRTQMLIDDLLRLNKGSIVELSKLAGEPLEVRVNNRLVARGEVVVVNEKFGVRLTDIIGTMERMDKDI